MTPAVTAYALYKSFNQIPSVVDVTFRVPRGKILALLGPSGCGKTTTLRLLAGFEAVDSGRIEIDGQVVADGRLHLPPEKRRVGMVFQDYAIFPHLSVMDHVQFGLGRGREARAHANEMLAFVGMQEQGDKMPHQLSGGQQQRVALARALAPRPAVLLLDEPFSNLDAALRVGVRADVKRLLKQSSATAVFVTHDQEEALFLGDEIAVMREGQIEQIGTPEHIFQRPRTRFVAEFLGNGDFLPGRVNPNGIETALGVLLQKTNFAEHTAVDVLLRADDVDIALASGANGCENGRIVDRQFVGIAFVYTVALADNTIVQSWQPHSNALAVGTAVCARFKNDHPLPVFLK